MSLPSSAPAAPILELDGISKRFGPVVANRRIQLKVYPGEIHAVLGENGAGKSTLMSILAGRYRPDSGRILLDGQPVSFASPAQALARGIGMVYQRFMLVDALNVVENLLLGHAQGRFRLDIDAACRKIASFSQAYGLAVDPRKTVRQLSMGERQRVEILKLLLRQARILIFDEPTAVLAPPEVESFFRVLRRLSRQGHTILFITHKLEEVLQMAQRISIMRKGALMATLTPRQVSSRRELARLMVGREIVLNVHKQPSNAGEVILAAEGLRARDDTGQVLFEDIRLHLKTGEILALTGVAGNGQSPLAAALAGMPPAFEGRITYRGRPFENSRWQRRPKPNMVYIPEDRHTTASVGPLSLTDNFLLTRLKNFRHQAHLARGRARLATGDILTRYGVNAPAGPQSLARQLSGGNLQKFILARELDRRPDVIIAESPTNGLDVRATEEIWRLLLQQREQAGVLLVSGDLREVLALADRVAVMFRGRILATLSTARAEQVARIGLLMAGVPEKANRHAIEA